MVLVYRIRNGENIGPYNAQRGYKLEGLVNRYANGRRHPSPLQDSRLTTVLTHYNTSNYNFGFRSLASLNTWFRSKKLRQALMDEGFYITVIEVPEELVTFGKGQCLFRKRKNGLSYKEVERKELI